MALGTYDRETKKKKQQYPSPEPTDVLKSDNTQVSDASLNSTGELKPNPTLVAETRIAPTQVAPAPQIQDTSSVQGVQSVQGAQNVADNTGNTDANNINNGNNGNGGATVVSDGDNGNLTAKLNGVGGADAGGVDNTGSNQNGDAANNTAANDVTDVNTDGAANNTTGTATNSNTTPRVKSFNGFDFSTVTADGRSLNDDEMNKYFDMLQAKSLETKMSIKDLDALAGKLLVGETPFDKATFNKRVDDLINGETSTGSSDREDDISNGDSKTNNKTTTSVNNDNKKTTVAANDTSDTYDKNVINKRVDSLISGEPLVGDSTEITNGNISSGGGSNTNVTNNTNGSTTGGTQTNTGNTTTTTGGNTNNTGGTATGTKRNYSTKQKAVRDAAAKEMTDKSVYNGNVDLLKRPSVDSATMHAAGYTEIPDGSYASVYSMQNGFRDKSKNGKVREILYTPIMVDANGKVTVLSQKDVDAYLADLGKKGDILELDKPENGGKGLVIAADVKGDLGPRLHELQEQYYMTPDDYAARAKDVEGRIKSLVGNQDLLTIKPVSKRDMVAAGWTMFSQYPDDEIYVHPIQQVIVDKDGKEHTVIMSPITKDGDILSPDDFDVYVDSLQHSKNILEADEKDGLILKFDAEDGDGEDIYNDITAWHLGQSDKDETQGKPLGELYKDETERQLVETADKALKDAQDFYDKYLGPNASWMQAATKANQDKLKEEGLDEESEKRLEKRRRTASLIANIGDLLQGFANLAGTWYGAKSSDLTSLSAARGAAGDKEDAKRQKRRDEIQNNLAKTKKEYEDYYMKQYSDMKKAHERMENQLFGYRVSRGKTEQRYQLSEEKAQRDAERRRQEQDRKHQQDLERDEKRAKQREDLAKLNSSLRRGDNDHSTANRIKVKQTPGASTNKKGKKKKGKTKDTL